MNPKFGRFLRWLLTTCALLGLFFVINSMAGFEPDPPIWVGGAFLAATVAAATLKR